MCLALVEPAFVRGCTRVCRFVATVVLRAAGHGRKCVVRWVGTYGFRVKYQGSCLANKNDMGNDDTKAGAIIATAARFMKNTID